MTEYDGIMLPAKNGFFAEVFPSGIGRHQQVIDPAAE